MFIIPQINEDIRLVVVPVRIHVLPVDRRRKEDVDSYNYFSLFSHRTLSKTKIMYNQQLIYGVESESI